MIETDGWSRRWWERLMNPLGLEMMELVKLPVLSGEWEVDGCSEKQHE